MTHTLEGPEAPQAAVMGAIRSSSGAPEAGPTGIGRQVTRPGQLPGDQAVSWNRKDIGVQGSGVVEDRPLTKKRHCALLSSESFRIERSADGGRHPLWHDVAGCQSGPPVVLAPDQAATVAMWAVKTAWMRRQSSSSGRGLAEPAPQRSAYPRPRPMAVGRRGRRQRPGRHPRQQRRPARGRPGRRGRGRGVGWLLSFRVKL
jgi:hypothetical protein